MTDDEQDFSAEPELLYEGRWLRMCRRGRWEYAERTHGEGMAVIIVAATPDDRVLFVEQPRVPLGARTIEMPAGLVGDQPTRYRARRHRRGWCASATRATKST